jgi:spore maturation protein B
MFRASGAMDAFVALVGPLTTALGVPPDIVPMALLRPLTGSGSAALVVDLIEQFGEDALVTKMAAVMFGSTETTLYVIAVYFGAVNVAKTRHALPVGLLADFTAFVVAIVLVKWLYG